MQSLCLLGRKERSLRPFLEHHLDDAEEEILLATGKMIVQSRRGDLHLLGDLFHRNTLVSPGEKEFPGCFENLLPGFAICGRETTLLIYGFLHGSHVWVSHFLVYNLLNN